MKLSPRSILFISAVPFGESLALLATLRAVRDGFRGATVTAAASTGMVELFSGYRLADEIVDMGLVKSAGDGAGAAVSTIGRTLKLLNKLRRGRFDLTIDCAPRLGTQLLALFSRGKTIVPIVRLPDLVDTLLGGKLGRRTRMEAAATSIIRQLELKPLSDSARFEPGPEVSAKLEESLRKQGFRGGEPLIVLYSVGSGSQAGWPPQRFVEVGLRLAANYGVRVVVVDQPHDSEFTNMIGGSLSKETIKLRAPRALELIGVLARASLLITDDAGVARFAARLGTASIDIGSSLEGAAAGSARKGGDSGRAVRGPAGVRTGLRASAEDVYEVACEMLQTSRTSVLFEK